MNAALPTGLGPGEVWDAPLPGGPLDATVEVPGSKSLTNRFLVLAALADGPVRIRGALRSRDSALMIGALRTLGIGVDDAGDEWVVTPGPLDGGGHVDCGLAGTVMRFVPPLVLLAGARGDARAVTFDGDEGARVRPMGALLDALRALGATIDDDGRGTLPFTMTPPARTPAEVEVDASGSSQFVTALLLVAPRLEAGLTIRHVGETLPSLPHIDMTCETLRDAGVRVDQPDERTWVVHPGALALSQVRVEPDLSNAGPFMAAALVAGGSVRIPGWPARTTQPGAYYPELLARMGGTCTLDGDVMTVTGDGTIHGIEADLSPAGEITPTIAALCALADSASQLTGIGHLRGHETDRLAAIATEVERVGGQCHAGDDSLKFAGLPPAGLSPAVMETYHDHRMATFAAIIGLTVPGLQVLNVGTVAKTMPDFPLMWARMLGREG
ncbi:3-phosphoshikimate 1-carboxyvinyltransferase [Demequina capsici]|uniref:3-phosphoshikimate 1-carboxyvinyltransferase n=1 Tax=Demequina capsici TaxID=3075620 RepID=A0AA96F4R3_9MICO|nr:MULTISPECIES: 3-phosphoshikimate 1-carboxyvinyltransferase [unclassified Demequina]WNM23853.1 3-phosphoshikimate 1-carboxyvinyltransferase [Demequina sp. OYTSA14]WNM26692.1 3-phosphoshikimate 1-carboxyvinyltransferase [Demequina sp. PMTSA13]